VKQLLAQVLSSRKVWRVISVNAIATACALGLWMLGGTTLLLLVIFGGGGLALSSVSPRLMEPESAPQSKPRRAASQWWSGVDERCTPGADRSHL